MPNEFALKAVLDELRAQASLAQDEEEMRLITRRINDTVRQLRIKTGKGLPRDPMAQAVEIDRRFRHRAHLDYLSERVANAVHDVENGTNRMLVVSMPPRMGKSTLLSQYTPLWILRRHPDWSIITASFDGNLTGEWARNVRNIIEEHPALGIVLSKDGGAGSHWQTAEGGGIYSASIRSALTGRGARVLLVDDPIKDYVDAHSAVMREALWNWWLSVAQTRLEPPFLVVVLMTRWHEDDFVGRLLSEEYEGSPTQWEVLSLPAIATTHDAIGRSPGDPLISPLLNESPEQALARWEDTKRTIGSYVWSSMYLQSPSPSKGAIFDSGWWRYWTLDPTKATQDGRVVYLDPSTLNGGRWLDSWDCAFKGTDSSDFVVGQRWVRNGADRFLIAQRRGRMSFTQTLTAMEAWAQPIDSPSNPYGHFVHQRLVEEAANGAALIDTMRTTVSGIKPVKPKVGKEARARNITPEIESGHVYLPHPSDPGNEWVNDLLGELRDFPVAAHDDQVDALTQALAELRDPGLGGIVVPGQRPGDVRITRDLAGAARSSQTTRIPRVSAPTMRPR